MTENIAIIRLGGDEAVQKIARSLYSGDMLSRAVREAISNSIDSAKDNGLSDPRISITLKYYPIKGECEVYIKDKAGGMDEQTILDYWLVLGKSRKLKSIGWFGMASATIFSNKLWSLRTQDLYLDSSGLEKPLEHKSDWVDGLDLYATFEKVYSWDVEEAIRFIYLSPISIDFEYIKSDIQLLKDKTTPISVLKTKQIKQTDDMDVYLHKRISIPDEYGEKIDCKGMNIILNMWMPAFVERNNGNRTTNLIFNINKSGYSMGDYPFSMSRDSLRGETKDVKEAIVNSHNIDSFTSNFIEKMLDSKIENIIKIIGSKMILGTRAGMRDLEFNNEQGVGISIMARSAKEGTKIENIKTDDISTVFVDGYKKDTNKSTGRKKLMSLWIECLKLAVPKFEYFGVGFSGCELFAAERRIIGKGVYYIINPEAFQEHNPDLLIFQMWRTACHEAAHSRITPHQEAFLVYYEMIMKESLPALLANLDRLKKILG